MKGKNKEKFIDVVKALEEVVIMKSGADVFSEVFKLIYAKMVDEVGVKRRKHEAKFVSSATMRSDIKKLFSMATMSWNNVFAVQETFNMNEECLVSCVRILEKVQILDYDIESAVVAFEYVLPDVAKKKQGQYFTPEHIILLMTKILKPKQGEMVIDPACGSGGYLINMIKYMQENGGLGSTGLRNIYGLDVDSKSVKIAQAIQIIAGDGYLYKLKKVNSIYTKTWDELGLRKHEFDVVISNPPFSGDVVGEEILRNYELATNDKGKVRVRMDRHILFIERMFDLLKPGGRGAVVLPQGVFNNKNMVYVREYLLQNAKVMAVVSLDKNIFRPYTDTKTSILFFRRWGAGENRRDDYPIFMAASERSGKDHLGRVLVSKKTGDVDHDLGEIYKEYLKKVSNVN